MMGDEPLPTYTETQEDAQSRPPGYPADLAAEEARPDVLVAIGDSADSLTSEVSMLQPVRRTSTLVISRTDAPPSYDSIFGKIKDAHGTHGNSFGFVKSLATILAASIGGIVCMAFVAAVMALPIAQLVIGLQNQEDCPVNDKIPLYLIVSGGFGIAVGLIQLLDGMCCRTTDHAGNRKSKCALLGIINNLMNMFMFAWFICGNVWVYKIYKTVDHDDITSENYCATLPYLFAFWCITSVYIVMGATCVIGCGCMCAIACLH